MLAALGLGTVDIFARLTSVPLAIALAARGNLAVSQMVLDDTPLISPSARSELIELMAPPIDLRDHGGHLLEVWHRVRDHELFWPWYDRRHANARVDGPGLAPELLDQRVVATLEGRNTYQAYHRAVWREPWEELLPTLSTRCLFMAEAGDVFGAPGQAAAHLAPAATFQARPIDGAAFAALIARYLD